MQLSTSTRFNRPIAFLACACLALVSGGAALHTNVGDPGPSVTLGAKPLINDEKVHVLFDGSSWTENWLGRDGKPSRWAAQDDGSVEVVRGTGDAVSKQEFGDMQVHLEFRCPSMPDARGQARGNSGVYLHDRYEVQILDSFGLDSKDNDCAGIYKVAKPLVNVCRPPLEWQTYDIIFRAPRFNEKGEKIENPRLTVLHNGVAVHSNLEVPHPTGGAINMEMVPRGPIRLQDHGNPVRYRNIWVRELD